MVDTNLLAQYQAVREKQERVNETEKVLKAEVLKHLQEEGHDTFVDPNYGTFSISKGRTTWTYSPETQKALEDVKIQQYKEQEDGTAEQKPGTPFLTYNKPKDA